MRPREKTKSWEIPRKILHCSVGLIFLAVYRCSPQYWSYLLPLVVAGTIVYGALDWYRFHNHKFNRLFHFVLSPILREKERSRLTSSFYYMLGLCFCLSVLPSHRALLVILYLALCDPAASVCGRLWGAKTIVFGNGKSLAGALGSFSVAFAITFSFYQAAGGSFARVFTWSFLSGTFASLGELLTIDAIDDNIVQPIFTGCGLSLLSGIFEPALLRK